MPVFFEVATLNDPVAEPFALIRIDTDKRVENGCEGVVVSLHWSAEAARKAANTARDGRQAPSIPNHPGELHGEQ